MSGKLFTYTRNKDKEINLNKIKLIWNNKEIKHNLFEFNTELYDKLDTFDLIKKILVDDYQFLTFYYLNKIYRKKVENYQEYVYEIKDIKKKNDIMYINNIPILPILENYNYNDWQSFNGIYLFNLLKMNNFGNIKNITSIKIIGPGELNNKELKLFFNWEDILSKEFNCNIKTIFFYYDWETGEDKWDKVLNEKYKYKIFNLNKLEIDEYIKFLDKQDFIIIDKMNIYGYNNKYICILNNLVFIRLLINIYISVLTLNNKGILIIPMTYHMILVNFQLFSLIATMFDDFIINKNIITNFIISNDFIIFKNYTKNINIINKLKYFIDEYIKKDKYIGTKLIKYKNYSDCSKIYELDILSSINYPPNPKILKLFDEYYNYIDDIAKEHINRLENFNMYRIEKYIYNIYDKSYEYAKKHNLNTLNIITNNKVDSNMIYKIFNLKDKNKMKKLKFNLESLNYATPYNLSKKIINFILINYKKYFDNNKITITDGTANIGGDSITFAHYFNKVNSIEINKTFFDFLKNNVNVFNLKNINIYNDDFLNLYKNLKQDIIYMDPPWGGIFYDCKKNISLYLDKTNIKDLIIDMLDYCNLIALKVPYNYNIDEIFKFLNFKVFVITNKIKLILVINQY